MCSCFAWLPICFGVSQSSDFFSGAARSSARGPVAAWGVARLSWPRIIFVLCCLRLGEASHPGPADSSTWTCGIFNPSGLTTKIDYLSGVEGDILLGSETHLTRSGIARLRQGLKVHRSHLCYVVPGAPCAQRVQADAGTYAGVVALSAYPARPLPHAIDPEIFQSARVLVCGIAVRQMWIQVGLAYGFPNSVQHINRTYRTECLLDELITRVACQGRGPRIVAGDFNHAAHELLQLQRLRDLGFVEIQDLAACQWGHEVQPTSAGPWVIDQMWISPELQVLLHDVSVSWDTWSAHATVQASFRHLGSELDRPSWNLPAPFPWPESWNASCVVDWTNPSLGFASWWFQLEQSAAACLAHGVVGLESCGRGQTLETVVKKPFLAPCKLARPGDLQPEYFGISLRHTRWFKQLRRIHALSWHLHSSNTATSSGEKALELWSAIKRAVGFPHGFCSWWLSKFATPFVHLLPICLPTVTEVDCMLALFKTEVRQLEVQLGAARATSAKNRRTSDATLVFRDCMRDLPQPVGSLVKSQEVHIEEIRHDDVSVVLTAPVSLDPFVPLVANGRSYSVTACCHDQVWLEHLSGLEVGGSMRQEHVISTDNGVLLEFATVWKDRWNRHAHVAPGQWDDICGFCSHFFRPLRWDFPPWSLPSLRQAINHKKRTAATGPDGISHRDLLAIPDAGLMPLLALYSHLEQGGDWPVQLLQGFVNCLDKQKGDGGVDSYRPIVIYPLITRLWSSVRARQALLSVAPFLPPSLHGGVPHKQAKTIWFHLAQLLELSHFNHAPLNGLAVDVQRAFNNLPREPIWCALIQLGFPAFLLRPWASFLASQVRRFRIRGAVGEGIASSSGYPEGCAWSVFSMAIADWMLTAWLEFQVPAVHTTFTFVDDWHIIYVDPEVFNSIWSALTRFATNLQLPLDYAKSFCWSSQSSGRKLLRNGPVPSVLSFRDLGAHQNFSLKAGNKTLVDRVLALDDLWPKLRRCVSPYAHKIHVLVQLAWPRGLHGISIVHLGSSRFTSLRSGAMKGLRTNRVGSNPFLRLLQHGIHCDPEAWAILQTVRELCEVGSIQQMESMLDLCSQGVPVPQNGPCAILVSRLERLGWTLCAGGKFHDFLGVCDVLRCPWTAFVARVQWSWPRVVAAEVSHRLSFAGIQFADVAELRKVLRRLGPSDQKLLQCCLDGTLYQDLRKTKQQRGSGSRCLFCSDFDSVRHRLWECPYFEDCRRACAVKDVVSQLEPCLSCHGWPLLPTAWYELCDWFLCVPPVDLHVAWPTFPVNHVFHLFVDGSCNSPTEAKLRYAAWGVTLASSSNSSCSLDHQVLACGHVQGLEQTSHRGELEALAFAFRVLSLRGVKAVVWSDCASVVKRARKVLAGKLVNPNKPHADIWQCIAELVQDGKLANVSVQKVMSHCSGEAAMDAVEAWAFWHNKLVDNAVGSYNLRRPDGFWVAWNKLRDSLQQSRFVHGEIVKVLLNVGRKALQATTPVVPPEHPDVPVPQPQPRPVTGWVIYDKVARLYRRENVEQLHQWWITYGVPALTSRAPMRWVSGFQLWCDFALTTKWSGPLAHTFKKWYLGSDDAPADVTKHILARSKCFLRMWKGYVKSNGMVIPGKVKRPFSFALGFWTNCYSLPWDQKRLQAVDNVLFELLHRQIARPIELEAFDSLPEGQVV